MKVTVSVGGRFHAFNLAGQLAKQGALDKLITSYPASQAQKFGIPGDRVKSVILKELLERGWGILPDFIKDLYNPQYLIHEIYDRQAAKLYSPGDICVAFAGFALHTMRKAKQSGAVTILERGSAHILYQRQILEEESKLLGVKLRLPHPKVVEKELKEYAEADYICVPSLFAKRTFLEKGIAEDKLIHIPYGVDLASFRKLPKEDKVFRVIYCGQLSLRKGVHYLLQAFSELNFRDAELWLLGTLNREMKVFLKKFDNGRVIYKGKIPQAELYKYYSQGSVFVIMSIEEGLAMVQPQAMACGLAVICTTNTGGQDLIREGSEGFIINIRDVNGLKDKLVYLHDNPDIAKAMGEAAKNRVSKGFSWDDYGQRIVDAYKKCLRN